MFSLLIYEQLVADIIDKGIQINPYDPCVAKKMVRGKQMTTWWYVEDLKLSHVEPKEVTKFMEYMGGIYR